LVAARLERAVRRLISPLPLAPEAAVSSSPAAMATVLGWPFGTPLRTSDLYDVLLRDQAVRFVENLNIEVKEAPADVLTITADLNQPGTWFCGSGPTLFRSMDNGEGWDPVGVFTGTRIEVVAVHSRVAGLVVLAGRDDTDQPRSEVWASRDCGENWTRLRNVDHVNDLAILHQPEGDVAFLATDTGLLRLPLPHDLTNLGEIDVVPESVQLVDNLAANGLWAVAVVEYVGGDVSVAVALKDSKGILFSHDFGRPGTFMPPTLAGEDIRHLVVHADGPRRYVTAAVTAKETEPGKGVATVEVVGPQTPPQPQWVRYDAGWTGGSCHDLSVSGDWLVAASHRSGVLQLNRRAEHPAWVASSIGCGLPPRDPGGPFQSVGHIAANRSGLVLVAADGRLFRRDDITGDDRWALASSSSFSERVTLSPGWLFTASEINLSVKAAV
jgi:hypothetical protein